MLHVIYGDPFITDKIKITSTFQIWDYRKELKCS